VREHVGVRLEHDVDQLGLALEVAGQHLERHRRARRLDAADRLGQCAAPEVGEVIAIDARDHGVLERQPASISATRRGSSGSGGSGRPVYIAEPARPGADIAEES